MIIIRQELIIVGCILVAVGLAICIVGYNKIQPTAMDSVVTFMEDLSGEEAPPEAKSNKSGGYALLGGGVLCFLAGIVSILKCRAPSSTIDRDSGGEDRY